MLAWPAALFEARLLSGDFAWLRGDTLGTGKVGRHKLRLVPIDALSFPRPKMGSDSLFGTGGLLSAPLPGALSNHSGHRVRYQLVKLDYCISALAEQYSRASFLHPGPITIQGAWRNQ